MTKAKDYNADGLRLLAHAVIIFAVDDYTGMKWNEKRNCFKRKTVPLKRKQSSAFFLASKINQTMLKKSSLQLCCEILGTEPKKVRENMEKRFRHDLSKRKTQN